MIMMMIIMVIMVMAVMIMMTMMMVVVDGGIHLNRVQYLGYKLFLTLTI
jgi:hypothetical protein